MSFSGNSPQVVMEEMSDISYLQNNKELKLKNETAVISVPTEKGEENYGSIEHDSNCDTKREETTQECVSYSNVKDENVVDNLDGSHQDPLVINNNDIANVKKEEYSFRNDPAQPIILHDTNKKNTLLLNEQLKYEDHKYDIDVTEHKVGYSETDNSYFSSRSSYEGSSSNNGRDTNIFADYDIQPWCSKCDFDSSGHLGSCSCKCHYSCHKCGKMYKTLYYKTLHSSGCGGKRRFSCDICYKTFSWKSDLPQHMKIHTGIKEYKCTVCGKLFTRAHGLSRHILIHSGVRLFKCPLCTSSFTDKSTLRKHLIIHTGIKAYSCNVCSKPFRTKENLAQHLHKHTGEKRFTCNECKKPFRTKQYLQVHLILHNETSDYKCDKCGKLFLSQRYLTNHLVVHSDIRKYQCEICDKTFKYQHTKTNHMNIHIRKKFTCEICNKSFSHRSSCIFHKRKHLPIQITHDHF